MTRSAWAPPPDEARRVVRSEAMYVLQPLPDEAFPPIFAAPDKKRSTFADVCAMPCYPPADLPESGRLTTA